MSFFYITVSLYFVILCMKDDTFYEIGFQKYNTN